MKRVLIALLMMAVVCNIAFARKKNKAGTIKDGVYCDKQYEFCIAIPDKWDASIKKEKYKTRIVFTKKTFDIPPDYRHAPNYTQIPKAFVYVDTTSLALSLFIDSLLSDKYKSKQKNKMLDEMYLLYGDYAEKKRPKIKIGEIDGYLSTGERRYTLQVARAGVNADKADHVSDFYGGSIMFVKKDKTLYIVHFICEKRFFVNEHKDFLELLKGFEFK